jgi:hypothetical protein
VLPFKRFSARLSTRAYTPSAAWQAGYGQRMVSRPEYLYIAIIRGVVRFCRGQVERRRPGRTLAVPRAYCAELAQLGEGTGHFGGTAVGRTGASHRCRPGREACDLLQNALASDLCLREGLSCAMPS